MKDKTGHWVGGFAVTVALFVLLSPAVPPPKVRVNRMQGVNNLARPFPNKEFVITNLVLTNDTYPMRTR